MAQIPWGHEDYNTLSGKTCGIPTYIIFLLNKVLNIYAVNIKSSRERMSKIIKESLTVGKTPMIINQY